MPAIPERLKSLAQHIFFAAERYGEHELANHASAGAYAFLLSATPALLLVLGAASALLSRSPQLAMDIVRSIGAVTGPLDAERAVRDFFSRPLGPFAFAFGAASLAWAARLFVVTVQRGIRIIWAASGRNAPVRENLLGFAVELLALVAAALCVLSFVGFSWAFRLLVNSARYDLLYGVFGNLIVLLVNVYAFFGLYFYFAEIAYVQEHFDALMFGRFRKVSRSKSATNLERSLFMEPERLLGSYGRTFHPGEAVFAAGELGRAAYFVYRGKVGVYIHSGQIDGRSGERKVAILEAGEIFGEMAHLLEEPRTATVRALEDSIVLELPPAVFEIYLKADADAQRRLADSLSARLKAANARLAALGVADPPIGPEE